MSDAFDFRTGADEAKAASKSVTFDRTHYLNMKDGESVVLRFITPHTGPRGWIVVDQHSFVPVRKAPPTGWPEGRKWPDKAGAVCRNTKLASGRMLFGDCYICEHMVGKLQIGKDKLKKPSARNWALACIREEVIENGQKVGYRDATREVTRKKKGSDEEETVTEKAVVVINLGYQNFFSILEGFASFHGTVLNQDFYIKRNGDDKDTTYSIVPIGPIVIDDKGTVLDLRNPEHLKRYGFDTEDEPYDKLKTAVLDNASERLYALYWDPSKTATFGKEGGDGGVEDSGASPEPVNNDVQNVADLDALAQRVKGYGVADAPEGAPALSEPTPPSEPVPAASAPAGGGVRDFG